MIHFAHDLNAIRFFSLRLLGSESDEAVFAQNQIAERVATGFTSDSINLLAKLTQSVSLLRIANLPANLMGAAEDARNLRTRKSNADLAAAFALQIELLLRPGDLARMTFSEQGVPLVPLYHVETVVSVTISAYTEDILARRRIVLSSMGRMTHRLFDGHGRDDHQLERSVSLAVSRVAQEFGLPGLTLQRLRDIGAILLLRDDKRAFRRVAALLDVSNVDQIEKRYRPFLD